MLSKTIIGIAAAPLAIFGFVSGSANGETQLPGELLLICQGAMRGMWTDQSAGGMIADNRGNVVTGGGSTTGYKDIPTTAQFRLLEGKAQLRLPQPPTCGICTGYNKWIDVKELKIDEDRISGKIRYDILTGVSFEIDRRTGIMTSKNGFEGLCEAQDLAQRKF